MTLISPGSAGFGAFSVDAETGEVRYDPQGNGGGWAEGVTQTRLRGLVRDRGTGALVIADLASVDVTRPAATPLLSAAQAAFAGYDGFMFSATDSQKWTTAEQTVLAGLGDPVGSIEDLSAAARSIAAISTGGRPVVAAGGLEFNGISQYLAISSPGFALGHMATVFVAEESGAAPSVTRGLISFGSASGTDYSSSDGMIISTGQSGVLLEAYAIDGPEPPGSGMLDRGVYTLVRSGTTASLYLGSTHLASSSIVAGVAQGGDLIIGARRERSPTDLRNFFPGRIAFAASIHSAIGPIPSDRIAALQAYAEAHL